MGIHVEKPLKLFVRVFTAEQGPGTWRPGAPGLRARREPRAGAARRSRGRKTAAMMQARHQGAFLADEDAFYDAAAENVRQGGRTPPTPCTPSEIETPRTHPDAQQVDAEQHTPRTPRSDDEQVATPPSEDGEHAPRTAELSYHLGGARIVSPPPRTGLTTGTMGWTAQVDALITPGGTTRASTGWASQADLDETRELGNVSGAAGGDDARGRARSGSRGVLLTFGAVSLAGLTEEQVEARAALRTRQLLRTAQGEAALTSDLNQMSDLLAAFDTMVLKAFRDTDDMASMLRSDAFWQEVDSLEKKLAEEEDLAKLELKLGIEIDQLEKEMAQEVVNLEAIMSGNAFPTEGEIAELAEGEESGVSELCKTLPSLQPAVLMKRYAKYRIYAAGIAEMQRQRNLDPSKYLAFKDEGHDADSGFASGARALWKRTMRTDHIRQQREAEKDGAFVPSGVRPAHAFDAKKLHFIGPVFASKALPSEVDASSLESSLLASTEQEEEEFVPGTRWIPPPMPELRPPAPTMPTRRDLARASWARPGHTAKDTTDRAKQKFFDAYLPKVGQLLLEFHFS